MKMRADLLLIRQGLAESQKNANGLIMSGKVFTKKEQKILTPGEQLKEETELYVKGYENPYVSRGGFKLKKAVDTFEIDFMDKIVLDIGSSTGGFTDVSLQEGAKLIYALDVGTNQLVWKLRQDDRVIVMEQTNFRHAVLENFEFGQPDIAVIDVSFISLELILPPLKSILKQQGQVIALIKPQFEADRKNVGAKGVIADETIHRKVLKNTTRFISENGFSIKELDVSPIVGGKGNIEFLTLLVNDNYSMNDNIEEKIEEAIQKSKTMK